MENIKPLEGRPSNFSKRHGLARNSCVDFWGPIHFQPPSKPPKSSPTFAEKFPPRGPRTGPLLTRPTSDADAGAAAAARPPPLLRPPAIALPPRPPLPAGADDGVFLPSPGPLSFLSGFFADGGDGDCPSFSQLLAGAMGSPPLTSLFGGAVGRVLPPSPAPERDADGGLRCKQGPTLSVTVAPAAAFAIPPGFSPASLLESPPFFSPVQGHMGMSHQQALAQVTAEALQNQSQIQIGNPVSQAMETATSSHPCQQVSLQQTHPAVTNTISSTSELLDVDYSDQKHQIPGPPVDRHIGDGYNWRKYGQKQVKGSEYPRSYYKCTHPNCPVKKKVERSLDGQVTEIIYKGQHNHKKPQSNRRGKEGAILSSESVDPHEHVDLGNNSEMGLVDEGENAERSPEFGNSSSVYRRDQELGHLLAEQFSDSADAENGGDAETDRQSFPGRRDAKRRNVDTTISTTRIIESSGPQKVVAEPKIIVQTTSEVDLLDDGYRWRKYGQKVVKGNPNPRSYYKCTSASCNVRKHVERASTDPKAVVTTYEGRHNHDIPNAKNSSHSTANNGIHQSKPENIV